MKFKGFFDIRSYEYVLSDIEGEKIICLNDEQKKLLLQEIKNGKVPSDVSLENFDEISMRVQDVMEERKDELSVEAMGRNNVKIGSRIKAIKNLSSMRIRNYEDDLMVSSGKEADRIRNSIKREEKKTKERIDILEEKLKFVGTYALDAVCLIDTE